MPAKRLSRSQSLRKDGPRPSSPAARSPSPGGSRTKSAASLSLPAEWDGTLKLFLALWLFRAVNSFFVGTYFHPDEFWQSLEVAHVAVFGYGALCWETLEEIRGFSFPAMFTPIYALLKLLGLDGIRPLFLHLPIVTVCALTAAGGDFATYCLAKRACGSATAAYALLFSVLSWFNFYCTVRPLSNPIESTLCVAALCFWPIWSVAREGDVVEVDRAQAAGAGGRGVVVACEEGGTFAVKYAAGGPREKGLAASALQLVEPPTVALGLTSRQLALLLAAIAVIMRPTCLTMWLCLGLHQLFVLPMAEKPALVIESVVIGLSVLGLSAVIDCWWYGHWVLPQLNFMGFNMLAQGAQRYGKHPVKLRHTHTHTRARAHAHNLCAHARNLCAQSTQHCVLSVLTCCTARVLAVGFLPFSYSGTGMSRGPRRSSLAATSCPSAQRCSTSCAGRRLVAVSGCSCSRPSWWGCTARRRTRSTDSSCRQSRCCSSSSHTSW